MAVCFKRLGYVLVKPVFNDHHHRTTRFVHYQIVHA